MQQYDIIQRRTVQLEYSVIRNYSVQWNTMQHIAISYDAIQHKYGNHHAVHFLLVLDQNTWSAGLCTFQLADKMVCWFNLRQQNHRWCLCRYHLSLVWIRHQKSWRCKLLLALYLKCSFCDWIPYSKQAMKELVRKTSSWTNNNNFSKWYFDRLTCSDVKLSAIIQGPVILPIDNRCC